MMTAFSSIISTIFSSGAPFRARFPLLGRLNTAASTFSEAVERSRIGTV